jgi:hypothetical protein
MLVTGYLGKLPKIEGENSFNKTVTHAEALELLDRLLTGVAAFAVTGGARDLTLTEATSKVLAISGALTAHQTLDLDLSQSAERAFIVYRNTTGAYDVKLRVKGQTPTLTLTNGNREIVYHDGVQFYALSYGGGGGGAVNSVFGRTGAVVAQSNDYTWAQIDKATSSLADIATRSASDLSSGTLPDGRFPATLPAASGANLTNLNGSNVASGTVASARLPPNVVYETGAQDLADKNLVSPSVEGAIAFEDGVRQAFNPNGTTPGLNVGSHTADPSAPQDGDLWYESTNNLLRARINGSTVSLGAGGGGGADTALSNLAGVAVNASLLPGTDNSIDLGGSAKKWRRGYFGSGAASTPSVQIGEDTGLFLVSSGTLGFAFQGARYWQGNYQMLNIERDDGKIRLGAGGGNDVDYTADGGGNAKITVPTGKGFILPGGLRWLGRTTSAGAPTTTELPADKDIAFHYDSGGGKFYLAYNHSGSIKKVELA